MSEPKMTIVRVATHPLAQALEGVLRDARKLRLSESFLAKIDAEYAKAFPPNAVEGKRHE